MDTDVRSSTAAALPPAAPAASPRPRRRRRGLLTITLFLLPGLVLFLGMVLLPVAFGAYTSFFKWNGLNAPTDFVGLDNFRELWDQLRNDGLFRGDLERAAILVVLSLVIQLP